MFKVLALTTLMISSSVLANDIGYSGRLVKVDGSPVTGTPNLKFEITYSGSPSTIECTETINSVPLNNGVFNVKLDFDATTTCVFNDVLNATPSGQTVRIRVTDETNSNTYDYQSISNVPLAYKAEVSKLAEAVKDGSIVASSLNQMSATTGQVLKWNGTAWAPAVDGGASGTITNITAGLGVLKSGIATSPTLALDVSSTFFDFAGNSLNLKDNSVTPVKIPFNSQHFDAANLVQLNLKLNTAGAITSGVTGLGVNVDNTTLEIVGNQLRVKAVPAGNIPDAEGLNTSCADGKVLKASGGSVVCADDTDTNTQLTDTQVDTFVGNELTAGKLPYKNGTELVDSDLYQSAGGNIGIGTTSPGEKLDVRGDAILTGSKTHTTGNLGTNDAILRIYNNLNSNITEKGAVITFEDNYFDGSYNLTTRAAIKGGTETAGNTANGFLSFYTDSAGGNSATEKMRITSNGNVGIGTTTPGTKLDVNGQIKISGGSPGAGKVLTSDASGVATWQTPGAGADNLGNHTASSNIQLGSNWLSGDGDNEGLYVLSNGNIGIGTNTPTSELDVSGTIKSTGLSITSVNSNAVFDLPSSNLKLESTAGSRFYINRFINENLSLNLGGGNVGIGTASPLAKLHVNGNIRATEICDETGSNCKDISTGWTDANATSITDGLIVDADINASANIAQSKINGLTTSLAGKEGTITAGTTAQYYRGDKTWQNLDKASVGLSNVTNDAQLPLANRDNGALSTSTTNVPTSNAVKTYVDNKQKYSLGYQFGNQDWTNEITLHSGTAVYNTADKGLRTTGSTEFTLKTRMPIDPLATYRVAVRVKKVDGGGNVYIGAKSLDENYANLATDTANSFNYFVASNSTLAAGNTSTYVGYISGYNTVATGNQDKFDPEAKFFDLFFITNYSGSGNSVIESIDIQKVSGTTWAANGNVGINTTSPTEKLEVSGNVKATAFIGDGSQLTGLNASSSSNATNVTISADSDANASGDIIFNTAGTTKATIKNNGNLGLGTTAPVNDIHVVDSASDANIRIETAAAGMDAGLYLFNPNGHIANYLNEDNTYYIWNNIDDADIRMRVKRSSGGIIDALNIDGTTGNVGVAVVNPVGRLNVSPKGTLSHLGTFENAGVLVGNTTSGIAIDDNEIAQKGDNLYLNSHTGNIIFRTSVQNDDVADDVAMTINENGRVGVGVQNPLSKFGINGGGISNWPNATVNNAEAYNNENVAQFRIDGGNSTMAFGMRTLNNSRNGWIQVGHDGDTNSSYTQTGILALNPLGGNIGIGLTAPSSKLHVRDGNFTLDRSIAGSTAFNLSKQNGSFGYINFQTNNVRRWHLGVTDGNESGSDAGSDFYINSANDAGAYKETIFTIKRNSGNVGVGTTSPGAKLDVNGTANIEEQFNVAGTFTADPSTKIITNNMTKSYSGFLQASQDHPTCAEKARIYDLGTINSSSSYYNFIEVEITGSHRGYNTTGYFERKKFVLTIGDKVSSNLVQSSGESNKIALWNGTNTSGFNNHNAPGSKLQVFINPACGAAMTFSVNVRYSKNLDFTPASNNNGFFAFNYHSNYSETITSDVHVGGNLKVSGVPKYYKMPAMRARFGDAGAVTAYTGSNLQFKNEQYDVGNNYNPTTYIFTAPVTGIYHINTKIAYNAANSTRRSLALYVNGAVVDYTDFVAHSTGGDDWDGGHLVTDYKLNAGDQVSIRLQSTGVTASDVIWQGSTSKVGHLAIHLVTAL